MITVLTADWLNSTFGPYDFFILSRLHRFAYYTDSFFTPFFKLISLFAENGIGLILLGLFLIFLRKTRKTGFCIIAAVAIGAIITNLTLKNFIARPRPYIDVTHIYHQWWMFVESTTNFETSFPSGHTTATMAAMTSIFLSHRKRVSWLAFLVVILMGISRNYLFMHYPSDILGGFIVGGVGAILAFILINKWFSYLAKHTNNRFAQFALNLSPVPPKDKPLSSQDSNDKADC